VAIFPQESNVHMAKMPQDTFLGSQCVQKCIFLIGPQHCPLQDKFLATPMGGSALMSDQLKVVLNRCVFTSVLKLVRDEADCTLLGRNFQTFGAHDEKQPAPISGHPHII